MLGPQRPQKVYLCFFLREKLSHCMAIVYITLNLSTHFNIDTSFKNTNLHSNYFHLSTENSCPSAGFHKLVCAITGVCDKYFFQKVFIDYLGIEALFIEFGYIFRIELQLDKAKAQNHRLVECPEASLPAFDFRVLKFFYLLFIDV